jgi:hypothetical protein
MASVTYTRRDLNLICTAMSKVKSLDVEAQMLRDLISLMIKQKSDTQSFDDTEMTDWFNAVLGAMTCIEKERSQARKNMLMGHLIKILQGKIKS